MINKTARTIYDAKLQAIGQINPNHYKWDLTYVQMHNNKHKPLVNGSRNVTVYKRVA